MLSILASGTLISDPKSRTSVNGRPCCTASMRVPAEDVDAVAALLALRRGDSCSIAGRGKLASWEKDGEQRMGLSVVGDRVLSAYAAGKQRKAARETEEAAA